MPTIQNPQETARKTRYRSLRFQMSDKYKPDSAQTPEKTDVSRAREVQSILKFRKSETRTNDPSALAYLFTQAAAASDKFGLD